jgi:hypothetical protein
MASSMALLEGGWLTMVVEEDDGEAVEDDMMAACLLD